MLVHLIALQCSFRCLFGLFELQFVHRAVVLLCCWLLCLGGVVLGVAVGFCVGSCCVGGGGPLCIVLTCCCLLCLGFGVLQLLAWYKNFPHHVLLHLIALQCSFRCLIGLSELQFVHRAG